MRQTIIARVNNTATALLAAATLLTAASCGNQPNPTIDDQLAEWWDNLTVDAQSATCIALTDWEWTGFRFVAEQAGPDGIIDLGTAGRLPDNHENRVAVGEALDKLAADQCATAS